MVSHPRRLQFPLCAYISYSLVFWIVYAYIAKFCLVILWDHNVYEAILQMEECSKYTEYGLLSTDIPTSTDISVIAFDHSLHTTLQTCAMLSMSVDIDCCLQHKSLIHS
jgi:hypothetical protein